MRFAAESERALVAALEEAHGAGRIVHGRPRDVVAVELDTYDRRLDRRGARIVHESDARGGTCRLRLADGREWRLGRERPEFAHDVAEGAGREVLGTLAGERRLLERARRLVRRRPLRLVDAEGKTVVRAGIEIEREPADGRAQPTAVLQPVRGYEREHARLCARLEQLDGVRRLRDDGDPAANSKPARGLPGDGSTVECLARLLEERLETFLAQEAGLRADLDPEFNHDLRVAMRRTRSLLGELGKALPREAVAHLRDELRWLGNLTGPLRDLDVLAAELRATPDLPPQELRALLEALGRRRDAALAGLREGLDSPRFPALVRAWRELVETPPPADGPGAKPFRHQLAKRLRKRSLAMLERIHPGLVSGPTADLHAVRIQSKKLRYLLECVKGLVPPKREAVAIAGLKRLQERLGALNDAAVQGATLERLARELGANGLPAGAEFWLGRLTERASTRLEAERAALPDALAAFTAQRARKDFERLLADLVRAP
ncbi:MAG TPA: CHAD domain-containing protein [Planctomycetota bacterium]|nr:CHAD domain-containing protein [Planctomycetota bacterium]